MKTLLGTKLGMTQIFDEESQTIPITVLEVGPVRITQIKTPEQDGYGAIQFAFGKATDKQVNQPTKGHYQKSNVNPGQHLTEVRVDNPTDFQLGQTITAEDTFTPGTWVDVTAVSKGKGYTGVMKRHNFSGLGASHGTHRKHRAPGAIGACTSPARVFRGMKMAGRMGSDQVTILNLEVVKVEPESNLLFIKGAVPGPKGATVRVRQAVKKPVAT